MNSIKVIAFDADDTLWVNETYFREAEDEFATLLKRYGSKEHINKTLYNIEIKNLSSYGYGAKAFTLSLIETAIKLHRESSTELPLTIDEIEQITNIGTSLTKLPIQLLDGVESELERLSKTHTLIVATKGDLLDQQSKLKRSGLTKYFKQIEVMSSKSEAEYKELISRLGIEPNELLMVGNSVKSDIIPVLNIGGSGIHIPFHTTWEHEMVEEEVIHPNFYVISDMSELSYFI